MLESDQAAIVVDTRHAGVIHTDIKGLSRLPLFIKGRKGGENGCNRQSWPRQQIGWTGKIAGARRYLFSKDAFFMVTSTADPEPGCDFLLAASSL